MDAGRSSAMTTELRRLYLSSILNDAYRLRIHVVSQKGFDDIAESLVNEMIDLRTETLEPNSKDTLTAKSYLASVLCCRQKFREAEILYREG